MRETFQTKLFDSVFHVVVGTLYSYALCLSVLQATVLEPPGQSLLWLCAGSMLLFTVLFSHRYITLTGLGIALVFCLWAAWHVWRGTLGETWLRPLLDLVEELALFARGAAPYRPAFNQAAELWLAVAFALVTVLNTQVHFGFYVLCAAAAVVLGLPVFMEDWGRSEEAGVLMVFCFLAILARKLYTGASDRESPSRARYALLLLPLSALVFGVSWDAPKPDAETVTRWADSAGSFFSGVASAVTPDQVVTFSEDSEPLGGPAGLGDEVVMEVEAGERLYLSGSVRDRYTGRGWTASVKAAEALTPGEDGVYDTTDHPAGLRAAQEYYMRYYAYPTRQVTVTMKARSRMVFSPPSRGRTELAGEAALQIDSYGALSSERPLAKDMSYTHEYISWNYSSIYFRTLLQEYAPAGEAGFSREELESFLALPDTLPARVKELAGELTAPYYNDYDRLKVLEGYLAKNYPYTLEPNPVPAGEDFVDYFLFTGKEGYCVYYASAMAVMARAVGIPTRYLEGYITPDEQENGVYTVTGQQAHAWVEAYIKGFGWVHFEPTGAYYPGDQSDLYIPDPAEVEEPRPDPEPGPEPDVEPEPQPEPEPVSRPEPAPPPPEQEEPAPTGKKGGGWVFLVLLVPALIAGGYFGARALVRRQEARREALGNLANREAVIALFGGILGAADSLGLPIRRGETPLVWAGRVGGMLSFSDRPAGIAELADIFSKAAYSKNEVSVYERGLTESCYDELMARLRKNRANRLLYLIDRYLRQKY